MAPEFAVMARAVLDTALEEFVDDETVRRAIGGDRHIGLERRIEYCGQEGVFDKQGKQAAGEIRDAGNQAAHMAPGLEPQMDRLLSGLMTALAQIERAQERRSS